MPFAVFKSIREVSSEDKVHCASNLLQNEPAKKWKTGEIGEKSAFVIIEMEKAYSIKGIDIGNECSAFVEVLVGGLTCARENFKEILITCSFMTPIESRNSTNPNRVRCFNREALVPEIAEQKWQLLKVVCTQPFNKNINYGLSFIKIHVDGPSEVKKTVESNGVTSPGSSRILGSFTLREPSPDSESESTTALFNRWKTTKNKDLQGTSSIPRTPSPSSLRKPNDSFTFKKIPAATASSAEKTPATESTPTLDRNRDSLAFTDEADDSAVEAKRKRRLEMLEKIITVDKQRVAKESESAKKPRKQESVKDKRVSPKKSPASARKPSTASTSGERRPPSSPCTSSQVKKPKLEKNVRYKPFNQLLNGVVLVISGIQNPDRADLRNKALSLGAKYKPDWDNTSTHLICAFKNTPKYSQVKGQGKIVKRTWVEDCHSQKKRLPWRRYALDSAEMNNPESEDEIFDESLKPPEVSKPSTSRQKPTDDDNILTLYDNDSPRASQVITSGSDTEDEIVKILKKQSPQKKVSSNQDDDIFEVSTEEEDYVAEEKQKAAADSKDQ